jgi:protein O-mannosyl-transferase
MIRGPLPLKVAFDWGHWDQARGVTVVCFLLAAITFAVFGQTAGFGFVNLDDSLYVYENAKVAGGLGMKGLAWVFTHADCTLYHPLTMLSLMADYQFHGLKAGGYHLTNVLLHTASVILLFLILCQMTGALWRSAFVAAVFAIHPLRVESVAWVAERKDVLGTFFFMLTLGAYAHYVRKPNSVGRYLIVVAGFVLALLSKPTVVTLPFVLLLLDYWPLGRLEQPRKLSRLILEKIPLLALAAGTCAITILTVEKGTAAYGHDSMPSRIGNAVVSYAVYLRQMIWPEGLAAFYPQPEMGHPVWTITLSCLLLALVTGGVLAFCRKRPWLLTGWLWYLGMLTPMIGIVHAGIFAHADRITYLPQIGLYLLLTWEMAEMAAGSNHRRAALGGLAAIILVALITCARTQTAYWHDSETLWNHALACTKSNYMADYGLGTSFLKNGRLDDAIAHLQLSLQVKPDFAEANNNLGNALLQKGRIDDAIVRLQQALQMKPEYAEAQSNLGDALLQKGRIDDAMVHLQRALEIKPEYAEAHVNLGTALLREERVEEAISQYQAALQIKPDDAAVNNIFGNALLQKGRVDESIVRLQQALQIKPDYAEACNNLGSAYLQKGRVGEAIVLLQKALQIAPSNANFQNNLAWVLATCPDGSLRNGSKAVELARRANEFVGGENPGFLDTLAASYAEAGRFSEAVETAQHALRVAESQNNTVLTAALQSEIKRYQVGIALRIPAPMP